MEEIRKKSISLIDRATDSLEASVSLLGKALALFLTGWFAARLFVEDGNIQDTPENYTTINNIDQAKASFFTDSVVPFLAGISLTMWNLKNLIDDYYRKVEPDLSELLVDEIAGSISTAFGFTVDDTKIQINPTGWLADIGRMDGVYSRVREEAMKAVAGNMPLDEFLARLKTDIEGGPTISGLVRGHFRTIIFDVYAQFDRQIGYKYAVSLGYRAGIYEGGLIDRSRPFCIERNGGVFTFDEIKAFGTSEDQYEGYSDKAIGMFDGKPKTGYDPFFDQGGHNCRHAYSYIPDKLAIRLRPELKEIWGV